MDIVSEIIPKDKVEWSFEFEIRITKMILHAGKSNKSIQEQKLGERN